MIPPKSALFISSTDALDSVVADLVRMKIELTKLKADRDAEAAAVEKKHQALIMAVSDNIAATEEQVQAYCDVHRAQLFGKQKSRETPLAVFGFELNPWRVVPATRKLKLSDAVDRLLRLDWCQYLNFSKPSLNKEALLADRGVLEPDKLTAIGIRFEQQEQFFVRPKPETADATSQAA